ncbi:MAG TPA: DeoR/GlpR family DNA-binding transcription regulator [Solirubrobacteraceae bacterium]|nr:DeoR/GlpR family DNA-binding transcription regulator [Solirubrobacteraceae bacterium]
MDSESRASELVRVLRREGRVDVAESAHAFGVAEMTIRRDLDALVNRGIARRVRGGAVSLLLRGDELPYAMREVDAVESKRRVASAVASAVQDGEAVVLDSGTTAAEVARALAGRRLSVMAAALRAANILAADASTRLLQPGGEVRTGELAAVGPLAISTISSLRFDTAIICPCGLAGGVLTAHDLDDAAVKQAMIASASRVIVAADSSKFGHAAMAVVCPLAQADLLVTDVDVTPAVAQELDAAGVLWERV